MLRAVLRYLRRVGVALDQLAHALLGGAPDATLSAVAWQRGALDARPVWSALRWCIDRLFWFEPDHCRVAWEAERAREQLPEDMRKSFREADQ